MKIKIFGPQRRRITLIDGLELCISQKMIYRDIIDKISPLNFAILMEKPEYRQILINSLPILTFEQLRILAPRLSPQEWEKAFRILFDQNSLKDLILYAPEKLSEEILLCKEHFVIQDQLHETAYDLDQGVNDEKSYQKISNAFFSCSFQIQKTNQMHLILRFKNAMKHPLLQGRQSEMQALIEEVSKRSNNLEKKYKMILRKLDELESEFDVKIPPEYLDPTTKQLLIPEECVTDPYTQHKQKCNISSIIQHRNRSLFTGELFTEANPPLRASPEFIEQLEKLHKAKGNEALREVLASFEANQKKHS